MNAKPKQTNQYKLITGKQRLWLQLEDALIEGDRETLFRDCFPEIADRWLWPEAMKRIANMKDKPHQSIRLSIHSMWSLHGGFIRNVVSDDPLLIDALRKLLGPYAGKAKKLYRGEINKNWKRIGPGISWSSQKAAAKTYIAFDPGVLLATHAPQAAIVAKLYAGWDHFHDAEYLVDRRKLKEIEVVG